MRGGGEEGGQRPEGGGGRGSGRGGVRITVSHLVYVVALFQNCSVEIRTYTPMWELYSGVRVRVRECAW